MTMPFGKFQVFYVDNTLPMDNGLYELPVSDLGEDDSVLFLWVIPEGLEDGLKIINKWDYHYRTCLVHNHDFLDEPSNNAEILLISTKGNPALICQGYEPYRDGNKPRVIRERIQSTYTGAKLELLPDGWVIWGIDE